MSKKEISDIQKRLQAGERHDLVILAIPSHDKNNKPLSNQEVWADGGMELFAELYGGATAFGTWKGIYRSESGENLWDTPILIESFVERPLLEDPERLAILLDFIKRMKRTLRQESILLVINEWRRFI